MSKRLHSNGSIVLLYVLTFCLFSLYGYVGLSNVARKLPLFFGALFLFFYTCSYLRGNSKEPIYNIFKYLTFITLISMVTPFIFWGQSVVLSYRVSASMLTIMLFFLFVKKKYSLEEIETYIWILAIVYIVLWLYAYTQLPYVTFGYSDEDVLTDESRGMLRVNFLGRNSLILAYFMALVKWSSTRKKSFLAIAIVFYVFIVLQLTRQIILWSMLVTILYMLKRNKAKLFSAIAVGVLAVMLVLPNIKVSDDSIIGSMINLTERQVETQQSGDDDVRVREYEHYFTAWHTNIVEDILGSGQPHSESSYGRMNTRMQDMYGFYLSDVGYAMMFAVTGIVGLALYLLLFWKGATARMPRQLEYVNLFMLYMIPANIAASWYSGPDCRVALAVCGYLIYRYRLSASKSPVMKAKVATEMR